MKDLIELNAEHIQPIKEHTKMKIQYISSYIDKFLAVACKSGWKKVVFVDSMCNAGIYLDSTLGTPTEVYRLFLRNALEFPGMQFYIYLNDYDKDRIRIIEEVFKRLGDKTKNVQVYYRTYDVNVFLEKLCEHKDVVFKNALSLVFVDPYNISTVDDEKLFSLLESCRVELIYNLFVSDFSRFHAVKGFQNKKEKMNHALSNVLEEDSCESVTSNELFDRFHNKIKETRYGNYVFSYLFKNKKKVDLYYIVYSTPDITGLDKLKRALWDVFEGYDYFWHDEKENENQLCLFPKKKDTVHRHGSSAKQIVKNKFCCKTVDYDAIKEYALERTMLRDGQIIEYIIKPLIAEGEVTMEGGNRGFKKNRFKFRRQNE